MLPGRRGFVLSGLILERMYAVDCSWLDKRAVILVLQSNNSATPYATVD